MSEAFHESQNGHHERVNGLFARLSALKQNEIYLFYVSMHAETINENKLNELNKLN
jgi:hypothetical protein